MDKSEKFQLRIEHLWALIVLAGIFIFVNTHPIRPHDFWWHIAIGKEIALATEPQLLCLDEPTAGMSAAEEIRRRDTHSSISTP